MTGLRRDWDQLPVLERMREDIAEIARRDAEALAPRHPAPPPPRRRRPRLQLVLAGGLASVLAAVFVVVLATRDGAEAVADLGDAPEAIARQGSFAYRTTVTIVEETELSSDITEGAVDLRREAYREVRLDRGRPRAERIGFSDVVYFRAFQGAGLREVTPWLRTPLRGSARPRTPSEGPLAAVPLQALAIRSLAEASGEVIVSRDERVGGVRVTHYRVRTSAATFAGLRGERAAKALRGVRGELEVWLDDENLPRRMRVVFSRGGPNPRIDIDTRFGAYGRPVDIRPPADATPDVGVNRFDPIVGNLVAIFGPR
jgi:hypothetical protein